MLNISQFLFLFKTQTLFTKSGKARWQSLRYITCLSREIFDFTRFFMNNNMSNQNHKTLETKDASESSRTDVVDFM